MATRAQQQTLRKLKGNSPMKILRSKVAFVLLGLSSLVAVKSALAQTDPQGMLQIFADASVNWQNTIFPFALNLFKLLAVVDFAWTCISVALEKSDFQSLVATIIKKLMTIGMFYALLVFAPTWFPRSFKASYKLAERHLPRQRLSILLGFSGRGQRSRARF